MTINNIHGSRLTLIKEHIVYLKATKTKEYFIYFTNREYTAISKYTYSKVKKWLESI